MSITQERKQELIKEYRRDETDSGSPEVQIAVLSERINNLTEHVKKNHKDHACTRGLRMLVSRRRRLLDYLHRTNAQKYREIIDRLGLRR
ncbi:MAG: 30S ribosomal protein S15 [Planctomycetaceae bacterium]